MGAYAEHAEKLIERGYAAIPIIPGTKRPGYLCAGLWVGLNNWQNGLPPAEARRGWMRGESGVGVVLGAASGGVVGFDIDATKPEIVAAIRSVLPPTYIKKIGAKGETLFYFGPKIEKSMSWNIDGKRVLDLIGPGRQTVLPPSIHPDTKLQYYWSGTQTLEDLAPGELPEIEPDIIERIAAVLLPFGYKPEGGPRARGNGDGGNGHDDGDNGHGGGGGGHGGDVDPTPHRQLNDAAMANLDAWVPALGLYRCRRTAKGYEAVPDWRPSTTGRIGEQRHLNLKIVPEGIRDFGGDRGYTPLDLVMAVCGCDLDTAFRFLNERLGWAPATSPIEAQAAPQATAASPPIEAVDPLTGEITEFAAPAGRAPVPPIEPLDQYTHVPGAVGNIVDWIVATARRPNRVLALGAAITIVGTLIGRRVAGPTRSATHLYVVPIGRTGTGKQHILDSAWRLMSAAKAGQHIGPSKFFSLTAVHDQLMEKPLMLCLQDEIGVFLKSVTSRKASNHEKAVSGMLRTLWGISFASIPSAAWATRKSTAFSCPALSILGVSTPDEFYGALQGDSVGNGFLNRFLTLVSEARAIETSPALDPGTVPSALAEELHRLYLWSGPESLLQIRNHEAVIAPDQLPWAGGRPGGQVEGCYKDFTAMLKARMEDNPAIEPYLARCGETSIRLATIRAAGRWGYGASVDLSDMEWGVGIAWTAGQDLAAKAIDYLPDNDRSEMAGKIMALIRRRATDDAPRPTKPRDIQMFIRGRLKSAEIKDIIGQLVEAGEVEWTTDGYRPVAAGRGD
jgi:hypothetical protein